VGDRPPAAAFRCSDACSPVVAPAPRVEATRPRSLGAGGSRREARGAREGHGRGPLHRPSALACPRRWVVLSLLLLLWTVAASAAPVHLLDLSGGVDPGSADFLIRGIE